MITFIVNNAPYGDERPYNALRLALALIKKEQAVRVFFMADGVLCALKGQQTPNGYYNIERMIKSLLKRGADVHTWGSCCDARAVSEEKLIEGVVKSNLDTLSQWVIESDKVINY